MPDKQLAVAYDAELAAITAHVLEMGGSVESQLAQAMYALTHSSAETALQVLAQEFKVNQMEVDIDRELSAMIARRQPTARDLRLLISVSKAVANLERVGDEAARIARTVQRLVDSDYAKRLRVPINDLNFEASLALGQLRQALNSFARMDTSAALEVLKHDDQIDLEFAGLLRTLITFMMEDPGAIKLSIDLVFVAKAIERVGDHAKNLAEAVIYAVMGTDVRHTAMAQVEDIVG
jgi:phosphate transport system protein